MSDLINDLSSGEDDFDIDLMAAGCRLVTRADSLDAMEPATLVKLYDFNIEDITQLIAALVANELITTQELFSAAEQVASGKFAR